MREWKDSLWDWLKIRFELSLLQLICILCPSLKCLSDVNKDRRAYKNQFNHEKITYIHPNCKRERKEGGMGGGV